MIVSGNSLKYEITSSGRNSFSFSIYILFIKKIVNKTESI